MKVLQINTVCGSGSTGRIVVDIYNTLKQNGHECLVAYGRGIAPNDVYSYKIGNKMDNYLQVVNTRVFDRHGYDSKGSTLRLIKQIIEFNPDIIHLHNLHGYYINLEILFKYLDKSKIPVVWTLHDCWAFTGHCSYFEDIGCEKWKIECSLCPQKTQYPKSLFLDNCNKNYKLKKHLFEKIENMFIVTVSEWLKERVEESFLKNKKNIIIPNAIDCEMFSPKVEEINNIKDELDAKYILLGVANIWDERKGLNDFLELAKIIDSDTKIILIGLNKKQIKNLPSNIIGFERTNSLEDLVNLYNIADVFINTSREETFGLVTLEALACGTPTIGYNCSANPELINSERGGIVNKQDIDALYNLSNRIIKNGKTYYTNNCLKFVKNFDKNNVYNRYLDLYQEVLREELF